MANRTRAEIKQERDRLWEEMRRRAPKRAVDIVKNEKPHIRYDENGRAVIRCSWGQDLPAGSNETYFWELLQDVRANMTPEAIKKYCTDNALDDDYEAKLCYFAAWLLEEAEKKVAERDRSRADDIIEVRRQTDFYKDEGIDEKEFEDADDPE